MNVITHGLAPVVAIAIAECVAVQRSKKRLFSDRHYIGFALAGAAPDLLYPHLSLAARYASWTHTAWFAMGFLPVAFFVTRWAFRSHWKLCGALMIWAMLLHLFCDGISGGIAWLHPVSDQIIGRYYVRPWLWPWLDLVCTAMSLILILWLKYRPSKVQTFVRV